MNETQIVECFEKLNLEGGKGLIRGIGDDCAVIEKNTRWSWLVTMDTLVESVHFDLRWHSPEKLGRKAIAVNVSDICAMGGKPVLVFLSLGLPKSFDDLWVQRFSEGISSACGDYNCMLAGGDTVRSNEGILISITAIGEVPADQVIYRSGAQIGDTVWVSGALGVAAAGLGMCKSGLKPDTEALRQMVDAHLDPVPRVLLARQLAENGLAHAMMDLSDGLATDLSHLCKQSGASAIIHADRLPISPALNKAASLLGQDPLDMVLRGGEDYELLFTAAGKEALEIQSLAEQSGLSITAVGSIVDGQGVHLVIPGTATENMKKIDISYGGFDHFSDK
jgi:thiamine-monophosphate kinase